MKRTTSNYRLGVTATALLSALTLGCNDGTPAGNGGSTDGSASNTMGMTSDATTGSTGADPGGSTSDPGPASTGTTTGVADSGESTMGGPKFDLGGAEGGENFDASLHGVVYGPDGEMPVSGALVYVTNTQPEGIPQGVYCAECEELADDDDWTISNADGSFDLPAHSGPGKFLVVQKGQFMRITPIIVGPQSVDLQPILTTLPDHNDPASGLYIPLIAVADASYDRLEDALGKFGLGETMITGFDEKLVPDTEQFALYDNGRPPTTDGFVSQGTLAELVLDPVQLAQYHIIFVPCSSGTYVNTLNDPTAVQNIRDWVAAGGRWYVADWSNEWLQMVFPEYQNLNGWDGSSGSADNGSYDSLATVLDDDLLEWLGALPDAYKDINPFNDDTHPAVDSLPTLMTLDNWSGIDATLPVLVDDGLGGQVDVGHKVWLEGPGGLPAAVHPLTVTGQFGCGKIQFTSYHAAEFTNTYVGLSPQELVLIYTILEIGGCQQALPPPG